MMNFASPFLGLSFVIHVGIIAVGKTSDKLNKGLLKNKKIKKIKIKKNLSIPFSLIIISIVSVVVFGGAGRILYESSTDKYSNIHIAEGLYKEARQSMAAKNTPTAPANPHATKIAYFKAPLNNNPFMLVYFQTKNEPPAMDYFRKYTFLALLTNNKK